MDATIRLTQEVRPPRDASHGTADPMVWRRVVFALPTGEATLEQTDYGHPGRFNAWEPRGLPPALAARIDALAAAAAEAFRLVE